MCSWLGSGGCGFFVQLIKKFVESMLTWTKVPEPQESWCIIDTVALMHSEWQLWQRNSWYSPFPYWFPDTRFHLAHRKLEDTTTWCILIMMIEIDNRRIVNVLEIITCECPFRIDWYHTLLHWHDGSQWWDLERCFYFLWMDLRSLSLLV